MYPKLEDTDMLAKVLIVAGSIVSVTGILQSEGLAGLGFLTYTVPTPIWFILLLAIVPTGETLRVLRTVIRSYGPSKNAQNGTD